MTDTSLPRIATTATVRLRRLGWMAGAVALVLAYSLTFQGSRGLFEPDEGRYADVALEMIRLGDWMHPALNHETPHFTKPPLTYWAIAGSVVLWRGDEWAVRLPNALAFAATVLLTAALGHRLAGAGPLAAAIYATSLLPFVAANIVSTDTLLTLWETAAVAAFVESQWGRGADSALARRRWQTVMWGAFGLAFLTKGPPGLLPLAAILLFIAASEGARPLGRAITVQGLLLFLGLGAGWFAVVVAQRPELLPFYLDGEVAARVATARFHRNPEWYGPLVVYLPALVAGTLPWTGAVVAAVAGGVRELRLRGWTWWRDDPQRLFLVLWFWLPLAVFSAARSRLHLYMVPLCVPLALVAARSLATTARGGWQELRFFTVRPVGARPPP